MLLPQEKKKSFCSCDWRECNVDRIPLAIFVRKKASGLRLVAHR
jgi:hypothetical protein